MERIKQAVKRARAERELGQGEPPTRAARQGQISTRAVAAPPLKTDDTMYSSASRIEVDEQRFIEGRVVTVREQDAAAEAYRILRTRLLQRMRANSWRTLAITSPKEHEGKTLTAVNLAISVAHFTEQTVVLVDADLRRPSVATYFTDDVPAGLGDYLLEEIPLQKVLLSPGINRLLLLPGRGVVKRSSEKLCSPRMTELVGELSGGNEGRLVLFDMPPVLASDDMIAFLPYVDAVMLVVEYGSTSKNDLVQALESLDKGNLVGTVLNNADPATASGGYY
jgi:capsular exopolysaccharide synthesis family protein